MDFIANSQFLRFLAAGGIAAAANFISRILFSHYICYELAIVMAYLIGMTLAFVLMRGAVFMADGGSLRRQVAWFTGVNILAVVQTLVVSLLFARYILPAFGVYEKAELIGHAFGVAVPIVTSYVGHRLFTFRVHESDQ